MAAITQDMKDIAAKARTAIVGTASKDGKPNAVPVGLWRIYSDDEIMILNTLMYKTALNIDENPVVAVTYWSPDDHYGYQLKGKARVEKSGKLTDEAMQWLKETGRDSQPKAAILIKVEEAYYIGRGKDSSKNLVS
jgi:predicted pyridoxine 5'-phosphate oxidase superfamily flavin-nucleotide-binding protein